ncbi:MAG: 2,3-diphosphoglycerate-dependent phosphoglycerate mutase [Acholeplasmataceae bacterium]|jgi:2,3-bisphosphoglycerate-dependent phosphoglycerate mutase
MIKLVLVRHGQSLWNLQNRFTGWTDIDLSEQGIREAHEAGKLLKEKGYEFDVAYTSTLIRANRTLDIILQELGVELPIKYSYRLNERHYGALQGLNKAETAAKYGDEQVHIWRRSADVRPPALDLDDPRHPRNDPKYKDLPADEQPASEHLLDTIDRVIPFWDSDIKPDLLAGKRVIISAHGNSIRALVKYLENLDNESIMKVEIPTGKPLVYELDQDLKFVRKYYL